MRIVRVKRRMNSRASYKIGLGSENKIIVWRPVFIYVCRFLNWYSPNLYVMISFFLPSYLILVKGYQFFDLAFMSPMTTSKGGSLLASFSRVDTKLTDKKSNSSWFTNSTLWSVENNKITAFLTYYYFETYTFLRLL